MRLLAAALSLHSVSGWEREKAQNEAFLISLSFLISPPSLWLLLVNEISLLALLFALPRRSWREITERNQVLRLRWDTER